MSNSNQCTYTFNHYREILTSAKQKGYLFKTCIDHLQGKNDLLTCVLRHDVDLSPERSIEFAKVETDLGIKATYFFRVHANEYNCLSYETIALIKDLNSMGHEIGLHAEPVDINVATELDPLLSIKMGKEILENLIGAKIAGVASHNDLTPNNNLDFFQANPATSLGFLYEAYDDILDLFNKSYYVTDSHPWYWRTFEFGKLTDEHSCLCKHIEAQKTPLYCLTHPHVWYHNHYHRVAY